MTRSREKTARVYTISGSGAFLATRAPSLQGAELTLELPLPAGASQVSGRVIYTNVPGTAQRAVPGPKSARGIGGADAMQRVRERPPF